MRHHLFSHFEHPSRGASLPSSVRHLYDRAVKSERIRRKTRLNLIHLESPCLPLEFLVPSLLADFFEVLLHLLAEAHVQASEIGEPCYPQIEMQNMVCFAAEDLSEKCGLETFRPLNSKSGDDVCLPFLLNSLRTVQ